MSYTSGIYKITNKRNGRIYIGQSNNVFKRRRQHFAELRAGHHSNYEMQADWNNSHIADWTWEVVEYCPEERLNEREIYWINQCGSMSPRGYNLGWNPFGRKIIAEGEQTNHVGYRNTVKRRKYKKRS